MIVTRYCRLQDLLAAAFDQVDADGFMVTGSTKQRRCHPAMAEVRALTTESRLIESELGLTPASESKAGVPVESPPSALADMIARRRSPTAVGGDGDDDDDDPLAGLRPVVVVNNDDDPRAGLRPVAGQG